jgi:hypothetical protein
MPTTRPCISDLAFLHYARPIHPEFFQIVASRIIERSEYTLTTHLTGTGHVAELQTNPNNGKARFMTEVATSAHFKMPNTPVSTLRFKGRQQELIGITDTIDAKLHFTSEMLERKAFIAVQAELANAKDRDGLFYHFGSNGRIVFGGLSYLSVETCHNRIHLRTFHTFPEYCRVLTTHTFLNLRLERE